MMTQNATNQNAMTEGASTIGSAVTTVTKRHPIRGLLYGIVFGLGLMLLTVGQGWAALGTLPPFILFVGGSAIGTLWGMYAPAKQPKGDPPPAGLDVMQADTSTTAATADDQATTADTSPSTVDRGDGGTADD